MSTKKRTLDTFFKASTPPPKKIRVSSTALPAPGVKVEVESNDVHDGPPDTNGPMDYSTHATYPCPVADFPSTILDGLNYCPAAEPKLINNKPHLDLLHYTPFIDRNLAKEVFQFLRRELFFYRVEYVIKKPWGDTQIKTPRYTTVFGVDATSYFSQGEQPGASAGQLLDTATKKPVPSSAYVHKPRPLPSCLQHLLNATEVATGCTFNFCLVNYYADGKDSISYHSDDERFLGTDPSIASFSFGVERDFLMRHKPPAEVKGGKVQAGGGAGNKGRPVTSTEDFEAVKEAADNPLKFAMGPGEMILMRGKTQSHWLHAIPKRSGKNLKGDAGEQGRINITFRRAMVKGGTENYYTYNVGDAKAVYRWDEKTKEMQPQR